ncbi:MAG: mannitol dehydrogenase [Clostridia bacterium]|nr:mannitol dehydrogenase [Clostridia bacterium]
MKQAVIYGAGNIGRGFIGQLFHMSGYEISFIDVNMATIERLNALGQYPIYITDGDDYKEYLVTGARGVDGRDTNAIAEAIASADLMATALGVNVLVHVAAPMAEGVRRRMEKGIDTPLNIIVCENMIEVDKYLAGLIKSKLDEEEQAYFDRYIGLVEPSIGRMVPATPRALADKEPLAVCVEPYCELPVDREAFKGEIPKINNMKPFAPFDFHIRRKLFMHNMSHALTAYLGAYKGYTYIWEAAEDEEIVAVVRRALSEVSDALTAEYGVPLEELLGFGEELLIRYKNKLLGDTVERVGRDTRRKLSASDRFVGAVRLCEQHGVKPTDILIGLAAGLHFAPEGDLASEMIAKSAIEKGALRTLSEYCDMDEDSLLAKMTACAYDAFEKGERISALPELLLHL